MANVDSVVAASRCFDSSLTSDALSCRSTCVIYASLELMPSNHPAGMFFFFCLLVYHPALFEVIHGVGSTSDHRH
jgi:hypothetical protein